MNGLTILSGDCRETLKTLESASIDCCVTSPPYWGLRDYGIDGQIGQEETPQEYVETMVGLFREVRRALKDDGTLWLNLGDSYNNRDKWGGGGNIGKQTVAEDGSVPSWQRNKKPPLAGIKPKDLVGIPWMVAFALREDGWYLRGDHVWGKPNGMPESVTDRPTRGHEYVFLLAKSARYYYNADAVRTAPKASTITRLAQDIEGQSGSSRANGGEKTNGAMKDVAHRSTKQRGHSRRHAGFSDRWDAMSREEQQEYGANLRSVWWIPPAQSKEAHFAVMPERVAEICILAGCPDGGTVLDPFLGSGTTAAVARRLGRCCIGCELNPEYEAIARKRNRQGVLLSGSREQPHKEPGNG